MRQETLLNQIREPFLKIVAIVDRIPQFLNHFLLFKNVAVSIPSFSKTFRPCQIPSTHSAVIPGLNGTGISP